MQIKVDFTEMTPRKSKHHNQITDVHRDWLMNTQNTPKPKKKPGAPPRIICFFVFSIRFSTFNPSSFQMLNDVK